LFDRENTYKPPKHCERSGRGLRIYFSTFEFATLTTFANIIGLHFLSAPTAHTGLRSQWKILRSTPQPNTALKALSQEPLQINAKCEAHNDDSMILGNIDLMRNNFTIC
jgi:hypothetical protein